MLQTVFDFGTLEIFGLEIPLRIYGYGLMLVFGFLCGIYLARWRARRAGENPDFITYCGLLSLVGGIVGSRLAYVIENWDTQFANSPNPLGEMLNVSSGGLIYYGGVVLAVIMVLIYLRAKRLPIRRYLDFLAISLMIGLAFGRAGCTLNGCCYGSLASKDWPLGMKFPMYSKPLFKVDGKENPFSFATQSPSPVYSHQLAKGQIHPHQILIDQVFFRRTGQIRLVRPREMTAEQIAIAKDSHAHPIKPAQVLGLINALLIAAILMLFFRLRKREGQVFALMVILYPITRFILESVRDDNKHNLLRFELTHNQYTSIFMFIAGIGLWLWLYRLPASAGPVMAQRQCQSNSNQAGTNSHKNKRRK